MAQDVAEPLLDLAQVKKAVQALLAYYKTKANADALLLHENENIFLMVTVWKIPEQDKVINIFLPHGIRPETSEVCIFTKDEPNMTPEQTERFYKALLSKHGIKNVTQVIPYKTLKREYKPYEAKRRLLSNYDLFLADDRIRRLLPSHIGKHFYKAKRAPLSVNLKAKNLAAQLNKFIQGTTLSVTSRGCCYTARVGHTGMQVKDLVENLNFAVKVIAEKLPKKWKNVKVLHLKTQTSVSLPIFTSYICDLGELNKQAEAQKKQKQKPQGKKSKRKSVAPETTTKATADINSTSVPAERGKKKKGSAREIVRAEEDEDMPQLVPIQEENSEKTTGLSRIPQKEAEAKPNVKSPLGNKKASLGQETPKCKRRIGEEEEVAAEHRTPSKQRKVRIPKPPQPSPAVSSPKRTLETPTAKGAGAAQRKPIAKSARRAPKTPKLKQKKTKVPLSA
ncbi:ribosomal L1 domain-containing protein 1 isoform X2 [Rhinatrema bivittatum]|uniref:ribosomal L1 domain-containing protein 1 isoform X2 n=1 Tax=Rhinatrema bivittatum TaxID=194408 RepID=UPI00112D08B1|nr:ribosomal L1 domain-containing protein 1 isoform X2 [Rhinatrema bivittatum]